MKDLYVSVDIEADGPYPGGHSMLSLGAAAFQAGSRDPVATFEVNLSPLPGATQDPDTMDWWEGFPDAWEYANRNPQPPSKAMRDFAQWVQNWKHLGSPVLVTYPTWDYMWIQWYFSRFGVKSPFGIGSLDLKSYAMCQLQSNRFKTVAKRKMPRSWFEGTPPHTHKALDDAIGQGVMWINMLSDREV